MGTQGKHCISVFWKVLGSKWEAVGVMMCPCGRRGVVGVHAQAPEKLIQKEPSAEQHPLRHQKRKKWLLRGTQHSQTPRGGGEITCLLATHYGT